MDTLKELKERNRVLRAQYELRKQKEEQKREYNSIKRQNFYLEHEGKINTVKKTGLALKSGFYSVGKSLKPLGTKIVKYGKGLAEEQHRQQNPQKVSSGKGKSKHYYKRIIKGNKVTYKKVKVKGTSDKSPSNNNQYRPTMLTPTSNWGWN